MSALPPGDFQRQLHILTPGFSNESRNGPSSAFASYSVNGGPAGGSLRQRTFSAFQSMADRNPWPDSPRPNPIISLQRRATVVESRSMVLAPCPTSPTFPSENLELEPDDLLCPSPISEDGQEYAVYFNNENPTSLKALNSYYGKFIPAGYMELDPREDDDTEVHPFNLTPVQIKGLPIDGEPDSITFGKCAINNPTLTSICLKNLNMRRVVLFKCQMLQEVSLLKKLTKLEELSLSGCSNLFPDCFGAMVEGMWLQLTTLQLANTPITSETLQGICPLPELIFIDLSHCRNLTDQGVFSLLKHPKLKKIRLEGTNVTDAVCQQIKARRGEIEIIGEPKYELAYYLSPASVQSRTEIFRESAQFYSCLRRFMFEVYKIHHWMQLCELTDYAEGICAFFRQELLARGYDPSQTLALDTPQGWFQAERILQKHDRSNLSKIMDVLVPILQKNGYLQKSNTVEDAAKRGQGVEFKQMDCFEALWEMTFCPKILNKIEALDFSRIGLTEIPLSFARLYFAGLKKISFAQNPIASLPKNVYEEFPAKKMENWLSKYPSLEELDFFGCHFTSLDEVFFFYSPTKGDKPPEREDILPKLKKADFSGNQIATLPLVFGFVCARIEQKVTIDLQRNLIKSVPKETVDDLASASPVKFVLDLRGNSIAHAPNSLESSVSLIMEAHAPVTLTDFSAGKAKRSSPMPTTDPCEHKV